jgi:hypothetical protein
MIDRPIEADDSPDLDEMFDALDAIDAERTVDFDEEEKR